MKITVFLIDSQAENMAGQGGIVFHSEGEDPVDKILSAAEYFEAELRREDVVVAPSTFKKVIFFERGNLYGL